MSAYSHNIRHYFWVVWLGLTLKQMSQQAFLSDKMLTQCQTWKLPQTWLTGVRRKVFQGFNHTEPVILLLNADTVK